MLPVQCRDFDYDCTESFDQFDQFGEIGSFVLFSTLGGKYSIFHH